MNHRLFVSFDIGNTLIRPENNGFCRDFSIKTGISAETLRPLFYQYFLTQNMSLDEAVFKVCHIIGYDQPQKLIDEFSPSEIHLFDDVVPTLEELSGLGIEMFAISNCTPWEAGGLEAIGIKKYLKDVFYSYQIGFAKPSREIFEYAQRAVNKEPKDIIHVGDSLEADINGALTVGWKAIFLSREGKDVKPGLKVPIIKSLRELPLLIAKMR